MQDLIIPRARLAETQLREALKALQVFIGAMDRRKPDIEAACTSLTRAGLACIAAVPDLQVIVGLLEPMIAAATPAPAAPDAQVDRHV